MNRLVLLTAAVGIALGAVAASADAAVIRTNWNERVDLTNTDGFVRLYVRKIEVTPSRWKAWVGVTNASSKKLAIRARPATAVPDLPFVYWEGPGLWWSSYLKGQSWWPGSGTILTHSARGQVTPAYPTQLAARKSWFGTFTGPTAKLPKDRLLRVGFGSLDLGVSGSVDAQGRPVRHEVVLSTTHQFKLPKRLG